ncbi:MAG: hypothetical protein HGB03_02910 [Candidatus Yonathbacteria bacterium]|nr:hypothetical protein [Candidatus Yonathbacteria bacterium]NTW47415.1 hypothetical protein [Candidatus Yonathbacteria bacterium]
MIANKFLIPNSNSKKLPWIERALTEDDFSSPFGYLTETEIPIFVGLEKPEKANDRCSNTERADIFFNKNIMQIEKKFDIVIMMSDFVFSDTFGYLMLKSDKILCWGETAEEVTISLHTLDCFLPKLILCLGTSFIEPDNFSILKEKMEKVVPNVTIESVTTHLLKTNAQLLSGYMERQRKQFEALKKRGADGK